MPYQTCLPMGCKALLIVEDDMRKEIAKSKQGSITVYALNGKAVKTMTALNGFAAGMKALEKHQQRKQ
jgi:invasion protein IalB